MKKIAIFVSGSGEAAERIVKLFNDGNRVHTVLMAAGDSGKNVLERIHDDTVELLYVPDEEWQSRSLEIADTLKGKQVDMIVLDNFDLVLSDEMLEAVNGEMIRVSSPEQAPREVVSALEADLRKPAVEPEEEESPAEKDENPTLESEWADTLKIQYNPPKVPSTPPGVPKNEGFVPPKPQNQGWPSGFGGQQNNTGQGTPRFNPFGGQNNYHREHHHHHEHEEPMPATYLIWSILVTIFCCFIPGIIAIIFSSQVSSKYYAGDLEGAKRSSRAAEAWIIVSVVLGVVAATLYLPFMLIGG